MISARKPESIQKMFDRISGRYDLANTLLSGGVHLLWKRNLVSKSGVKKGSPVLDCATGTGDLAALFQDQVGATGRVIATDFSEGMLEKARVRHSGSAMRFEWADVHKLPFGDREFDLSCISFGIRNVQDPVQGLRELARVVKPGGRVMVLEFGQPSNGAFGSLYRGYSKHILPRLGGWVSGDSSAYRYLHDSSFEFPYGEKFLDFARATQAFSKVSCEPLMLGIAYLYTLEVAG